MLLRTCSPRIREMKHMRLLAACDLDNTLIHSYRYKKDGDICVEYIDGREQGFMSGRAYELLRGLPEEVILMPVTSRSEEQYRRIRLPVTPPLALVAQGGILLRNGIDDAEWRKRSLAAAEQCSVGMAAAADAVGADEFCDRARLVSGMFLFTKSSAAEKSAEQLKRVSDLHGLCILTAGSKLYVMPKEINKGRAVNEIRRQLGAELLFCAGDSEPDISMLNEADKAFVPVGFPSAERITAPAVVRCESIAEEFLKACTAPVLHG